ncbi:FAD/FMN-containing dehydrogenase [Klebsiella pneumoniae]|uniref:FAD/FMN-containing dehydrogenase n=1 Tax=Klebsiella pneumoniae TaxID=573 RepID=A0A378F6V4_KLEPN|nr:FAD/FMN-containing dehydrogenase [Klebsiella pneumoniae]
MTVEPVPRVLTGPGSRSACLHHAYGTNGIILEVELAPAHQWIERLDVFDDFADALNYANACVRSPGLVKRQVALLATPIADYFSHLKDRYRRRAACGYQPDRRGERRTLRQPVYRAIAGATPSGRPARRPGRATAR